MFVSIWFNFNIILRKTTKNTTTTKMTPKKPPTGLPLMPGDNALRNNFPKTQPKHQIPQKGHRLDFA